MSDHQVNPHQDTVQKKISRRRCLQIVAASCGAGLCLGAKPTISAALTSNDLKTITWQGVLLGADASIILHTHKESAAKSLIVSLLKEVKRLEGYFSLYQDHSLIAQLNRSGTLSNPPLEFYELIRLSLETAALTKGRFDPTVQPLFMAYKALAAQQDGSVLAWEKQDSVIHAKNLIGWRKVSANKSKIELTQSGMGLTLNGIAQGYITDRALDILAGGGLENSLVNFGEYHSLGSGLGKKGWDIQLGKGDKRPVWNLQNQALATSARDGLVFDKATGLHHLLDPQTGVNQIAWQEIYVCAKRAALADAASTALFAAPEHEVSSVFDQLDVQKALLIKHDGTISTLQKMNG